MKLLRVLCVLAIALCLTASVYAETQSVKVSGDLTMRGIWRNQYDLHSSPPESQGLTNPAASTPGPIDSSKESWAMSVAAIQVDADLTDNVQTVIRVLNQRDWNVYGRDNSNLGPGVAPSLVPNGRGIYNVNTNVDEFNVMIDLAYVTLKDFIYSPLTLTIGRQNLWFGRGFIVGANQQNPGGNSLIWGNNPNILTPGNLSAPEYTAINSFDAVKAVLDYDPWTITGVYSSIYNNAIQANDNVDLWGVNVGYKFDSYKAEAEAYWFGKFDREVPNIVGIKNPRNDVQTIGLRGSVDPISWVSLAGEGAYQGGSYMDNVLQSSSRARSAWALDFSGEVRYWTDKFAWKPKIGAEYIYYSGNMAEDNTRANTGTYNGWDFMYRGKFDSAIREYIGRFYQTARYPANPNNGVSCADASFTNQHQVIFLGSIQPVESLTLKANYNLFWTQEDYLVTAEDKSGGYIGSELDLNVNWDYTEDVSFGLLAGWFMPGTVYNTGDKASVATDLVGTVKVSF